MADEPESMVPVYLRRLDTEMDRITDDVADVKVRMTAFEEGQAGVHRRLDRLEHRVERIERRLDLVDATH